jgi:hypothetical protein
MSDPNRRLAEESPRSLRIYTKWPQASLLVVHLIRPNFSPRASPEIISIGNATSD